MSIRVLLWFFPLSVRSRFHPLGSKSSVGVLDNHSWLCYQNRMSITEIKAMTRDEQLLAMEMLWNELCHQDREPESPEWHKDILDGRRFRIAEGDAQYLTVDQLRARFRP